ncbi:MAG: GntR family transcriptional regulator [Firmicutes bacterium]|nr:GntR family transcriptional regulator [Bacillota bacterium]
MESASRALVESVSRDNPIPLYLQIKEFWRKQIEGGALQPGDQIPTDQELCERYDVSRITVKQAINALVNEGLVIRRQGKGTFVAKPKLQQDLLKLTSFTEDMWQRGLVPGASLLSKELIPAPSEIAKSLQLKEGEKVVRIQRLRLADNEPLAVETLYVPYAVCPELLGDDLGGQSFYGLLENRYGLRLNKAEQFLEGSLATKKEAHLLRIREKDAVLLTERITSLEDGRPVEFAKSVYRGDKYKFHVVLHRHP